MIFEEPSFQRKRIKSASLLFKLVKVESISELHFREAEKCMCKRVCEREGERWGKKQRKKKNKKRKRDERKIVLFSDFLRKGRFIKVIPPVCKRSH